jgi:hypothetical protein
MAAPLLWLGLYPQPLFNAVRPGLAALQQRAVRVSAPAASGAVLPPPAAVSVSSTLDTAAAQPATADTSGAPAPGGAQ